MVNFSIRLLCFDKKKKKPKTPNQEAKSNKENDVNLNLKRMEMEDDALYLQLHKLSAVKSEEALDQLVSTLWKTRKTGLRSFQEKSNLQSLLNLPFLSDLDLA